MVRLLAKVLQRPQSLIAFLLPEAMPYFITPFDKRFKSNVDRLRQLYQEIIDDRRKKPSLDQDLLSIMLEADLFQGNDELMKDEMFGIFLAGMKTIQTATTNLIYYVERDPEIKKKLLEEILPPVQEAADNILENLTYDRVMEFNYLQKVFNESLRIEAPLAMANYQ